MTAAVAELAGVVLVAAPSDPPPRVPALGAITDALARWHELPQATRDQIARTLTEVDYHARVIALATGWRP